MAWPFKRKQQEPTVTSAYFGSEPPLVSYWSYFEDREAAKKAAERLRAQELTADVQASAGKKSGWLVLAYMPLPDDEFRVQLKAEVVKGVAGSLGGEYDGWEAGPLPDEDAAHKIQGWFRQTCHASRLVGLDDGLLVGGSHDQAISPLPRAFRRPSTSPG